MADATEMVATCIKNQPDRPVGSCARCAGETDNRYRYCALCCIKEDLGEWTRTTWREPYYSE